MASRKGPRGRIDFARISAAVAANAESLLAELLPGGKRNGANWVACNPLRGEKHASFSVSIETGAFFDHASGDKGGDFVALYAYLFSVGMAEAAAELGKRYGVDDRVAGPAPAQQLVNAKPRKAAWTPIVPVPADAGPPPVAHAIRGRADSIWEYRMPDGRLAGVVHRYTTSDGGKEIVPYSFAARASDGRREWRALAMPEPRPLYGAELLRDGRTVLVVEGEKCADAARAVLGDALDVVSWAGGGNAMQKTDWTPLSKRNVIIWPDCDAKRDKKTEEIKPASDQPGIRTAEKIAGALMALEAAVRIVVVPEPGDVADGWDIADAIAEGWSAARLRDFLMTSLRAPEVATPAAGAGGAPSALPGPPGDGQKPPDRDWQMRLVYRRGELVGCLANIVEILRHSTEYCGVLAFDEFAMRIVKRRATPNHLASINQSDEWNDDDDGYVGIWLQQAHRLIASTALVSESVSILARERRFHPVRDYLHSLKWDGQRRVDRWLFDYLGVPLDGYSKRVARWYLMGMCKRALEPGCKFDYCLVLEGKQGLLKSTAFRVLGGEWYSDVELDLQNKDAMSSIRGKWVHEFAEMGSIARSEELRQKSFLSRQVDEFRPAFGRREIRCPRQLVFGGTTNQWAWNKDPTGGRRFWPVEVIQAVDVAGLEATRDQLFAEAMTLVAAGKRCWPTFDEQKELFDAEQLKREAPEAYVELLDRWFDRDDIWWQTHGEFSISDAIVNGLKIEPSKITRDIQTRVGIALTKLECERIERRQSAARFVYKRPARKAVTSEAFAGAADDDGGGDVPW